MESSVRPKSNSGLSSSPVRSNCFKSTEDIFTDGLIDLNQLNYILRNPELPKSRLQMKSILRQYNEEKRKAITLSRINYTLASNYSQLNCGNTCNTITNNTTNNCNNNNINPNVSIDLEQLADFEVKFSQLPQELLINILGETFAKYEEEIDKRNQRNSCETNGLSVKEEVMSDSENDCQLIDNNWDTNEKMNEMKEKLLKLINEYESVDCEEKLASNELLIVSQELQNKLSELRECIEFCEILKQKNFTINQKQSDLKTRKLNLKEEIKEINEKLIELNDYNNSMEAKNNNFVNNKVVSENVSPKMEINFPVIDLTKESNIYELNSMKLCENNKKRKSAEINATKCVQKENNKSITESIVSVKKSKNNSQRSFKTSANKSNKLSDNRNKEVVLDSEQKNEQNIRENNEILVSSDSVGNQMETNNCVNWKDNYVNIAINPIIAKIPESSSSLPQNSVPNLSSITSASTSNSPPLTPTANSDETPIVSNSSSTSAKVQNRVTEMNSNLSSYGLHSKYNSLNRNQNQNNRHFYRNKNYDSNRCNDFRNNYKYSNNCENLLEVCHRINSSFINRVPNVTCLFATNDDLYVGLQYGFINKYTFMGSGLQFTHQFPKLGSDISALYYSQKYSYLYCGTTNGLFAYLNYKSNDLSYNKIEPKLKCIVCFECSATILFIGLRDGSVHRFGLMSNKIVNSFKCLDVPIIQLKLLNDCSDRIIVCGNNEISIRNSINGSLLHTLEKSENNCQFVCTELFSNKIIICSNVMLNDFHQFCVYDEKIRDVINSFQYKSTARYAAMNSNCLYVLTNDRLLYCFNFETSSLEWTAKIKVNILPVCMTVSNKRVIIGLRFGKIIQIIADPNSPIVCRSEGCEQRFPRICDIFEHFDVDHALPFHSLPNNDMYFHCPWIGCDRRIRKSYESIRMIVEHMKTHVV